MNVQDKIQITDHHSIEWGEATWTKDEPDKDFSIRNRYDSDEGRFNKAGSSEIPWADFNEMIKQSIIYKYFSEDEVKNILLEITKTYIKL